LTAHTPTIVTKDHQQHVGGGGFGQHQGDDPQAERA
jgi:hypothetical protein